MLYFTVYCTVLSTALFCPLHCNVHCTVLYTVWSLHRTVQPSSAGGLLRRAQLPRAVANPPCAKLPRGAGTTCPRRTPTQGSTLGNSPAGELGVVELPRPAREFGVGQLPARGGVRRGGVTRQSNLFVHIIRRPWSRHVGPNLRSNPI